MQPGAIAASLESLPERFVGSPEPLDVRFRLRVGRTVRDVSVRGGRCEVQPATGSADVEIATDPATWNDIDCGRRSGIEAFAEQRLTVRGSIERSLQFEPLFARNDAGALRYALERVDLGRLRISTLLAGDAGAEPLILLHGLGATKASWLTIVPQLARRYRVIAPDLPGFGASSKPRGSYNAAWFADHVFGLLDVLGYEHAYVVGNSMGGRIAQEMAMQEPRRVRAIACLCPATAFSRRPLLWLARAARPELSIFVARLARRALERELRLLFAQPDRIASDWYEAAIDDFLRTWRSPRARVAFACALRQIYMEEPEGELGFWERLAAMRTPALYVYGEHDVLITARFAEKVRRALPSAQVLVWDDCGHVPQLEHADRTAEAIASFFASIGRHRLGGGTRSSDFRTKLWARPAMR